MIDKSVIQSIINKYYLGENESVNWVIKNRILTIDFMSVNKEVIGKITYYNFNMSDSELAIFNTKKLLNLINITQGELNLTTETYRSVPTKLNIKDVSFDITFPLADPLLISKVGTVNNIEWDVELELNKDNITNLIKAKNALSESDMMTINSSLYGENGNHSYRFTFGDEKGHNNKISYNIIGDTPKKDISIPFNSELFKNILNENKDMHESTLSINSDGLLYFKFTRSDITSEYYMVRKAEDNI
jgi:hypothetical protein